MEMPHTKPESVFVHLDIVCTPLATRPSSPSFSSSLPSSIQLFSVTFFFFLFFFSSSSHPSSKPSATQYASSFTGRYLLLRLLRYAYVFFLLLFRTVMHPLTLLFIFWSACRDCFVDFSTAILFRSFLLLSHLTFNPFLQCIRSKKSFVEVKCFIHLFDWATIRRLCERWRCLPPDCFFYFVEIISVAHSHIPEAHEGPFSTSILMFLFRCR